MRKTKRREGNAPSNKSMDVRRKQRLSYDGSSFPFTCVLPVSAHVRYCVGSQAIFIVQFGSNGFPVFR
ncbi:MAG: hypothetical protein ABR566_17690, partial [Pyrinomonadaceae bacterium]